MAGRMAFAVLLSVALACADADRSWRDAVPHAGLAPGDVVVAQLDALREGAGGNEGIAVAFRFASPGNRRSTGPVERFARMIREGPYEVLLGYDGAHPGPVEVDGDSATQRVTIVRGGTSRHFVFILTRQWDGDCVGCWMTDAVLVEEVDEVSI